MKNNVNEPFVSIVTPMLNGVPYIVECIESVVGQTYQNWEYVLIDNGSTDETLTIANDFAGRDERIRVIHKDKPYGIIQDWNFSMRQISPRSVYCKVIHQDDWLFPNCISAMVARAQESEAIGLVSAYRLNGNYVDLDGLPYPSRVIPGHEIGRMSLGRNPLWLFGSPSSVLYRADVVRNRDPFYDESVLHADTDACFRILQDWDFGFVHDILSYTRKHDASVSSSVESYGTNRVERLVFLRRYGPIFLGEEESRKLLDAKIRRYHKFLVQSYFQPHPDDFTDYHRKKTQEFNIPVKAHLFAKPLAREIVSKLTGMNN